MRPCRPSSRHWRPMRRGVIYRTMADSHPARRGNCAWIRLGAEAGSESWR